MHGTVVYVLWRFCRKVWFYRLEFAQFRLTPRIIMFKGCHFPSEVILETVRHYLAYKLSYREIEEIQRERGVSVDHATINRWVMKFAPVLEHKARSMHISEHSDQSFRNS